MSDPAAWQQIETAPKDGTVIDLHDGENRYPDCYLGMPDHCCGEAGQYCDSDWHGTEPGWVDSTFNELTISDPTHWMPRPAPPAVADTCRDAPENVGLLSGASSDPFSSTRKDERA